VEFDGRKDRQNMKQYVIDQLRGPDHDLVLDFLGRNATGTVFGEIFWVDLPKNLYSEIQQEHLQCQPYYFAVNLAPAQVDFELLIRSRQVLRCNCIAYANAMQREYIIRFADDMLDQLNIRL